LIESNIIYDNITGVVTDFASPIIRRNLIFNNSSYGIDNRNANDQNEAATIDHNTIDNNGDAGINCDNSNPSITNNIITNTWDVTGNCGGSGIRATSNGFPTSKYNNVWNNLGGDYCDTGNGGILSKEGDISDDPLFVDASNANYNLLFGSPCIDTGNPGSPLDPDGTRSDMGALPFNNRSVPVELVFFKGSFVDRHVVLEWGTQSETNNFGFEIERGSNKNWLKIGFVKGRGTTSIPVTYSFEDHLLDFEAKTIVINYRLRQIDLDGSFKYSDEIEVFIPLPSELRLSQNYPNPFNPSTQINYSIPQSSHVSLKIFSVTGSEVKALVDEFQSPGHYQVSWDGTGKNGEVKSAGTYFATIKVGEFKKTIKLTMLK
jgi:hypothetical protein